MAETINYAPMLPKEPPADLIDEAIRQGAFKKTYLIYRAGWRYEPLEDRKVRAVEVTCSACKKIYVANRFDVGQCAAAMAPAPFGWEHPHTHEALIHGKHTLCPVCGAEAETVHVGNVKSWIENYAYMTQITRLPVAGGQDRLCLIEWQVRRDTDKTGGQAFVCNIWTAWVVEDTKIVRIMGYYKNLNRLMLIKPVQRQTFLDDYGKLNYLYPLEAGVLDGTTAENSKLDMYIAVGGKCLVAYLALWKKRPAVENLVTQGYGAFVDELIDKDQTAYSYERHKGIPKLEQLGWKKKKPHELLKMEKWQYRMLRGRMTKANLDAVSWAAEQGVKIRTPEQLEWIIKQGVRDLKNLKEKAPDFWRAAKYLEKDSQRKIGTLIDYWEMAKKLKMDLTEPCVLLPKNLKRSHDYAVDRYNELKSELTLEGFREREKQLCVYSFCADGMLIRPCATEAEMKAEGKALHHCVGTYAQHHAEGKTAIFLVRKEDEPDAPWFTLQLDEEEMVVRQNRGLRNCAPPDEEKAFVEKWLSWAKTVERKNKKGENAA